MTSLLVLCVFVGVVSLVLMIVMVVTSRQESAVLNRVESLAHGSHAKQPSVQTESLAKTAASRISAPLMPRNELDVGRLRASIVRAGLYAREAAAIYVGVKVLLVVGPLLVALLLSSLGVAGFRECLLSGATFSILGLVTPGIWLRRRKAARQTTMRRALPDALDMIVICIDGGLSLSAALHQVARELKLVHPLAGFEFGLVVKTAEMGMSLGETLQQLAYRFDLEELRRLASMVLEADQFGSSIGKPLRIHADALRVERKQAAEEAARKAAITVLMPTILLIFPCIFIVVMGPAVIRLKEMFDSMAR